MSRILCVLFFCLQKDLMGHRIMPSMIQLFLYVTLAVLRNRYWSSQLSNAKIPSEDLKGFYQQMNLEGSSQR